MHIMYCFHYSILISYSSNTTSNTKYFCSMVDSMLRVGYYANYGLFFIELLEEHQLSKFALGWLLGLSNICGIIVGKTSLIAQ